jgi:hypothetical protein
MFKGKFFRGAAVLLLPASLLAGVGTAFAGSTSNAVTVVAVGTEVAQAQTAAANTITTAAFSQAYTGHAASFTATSSVGLGTVACLPVAANLSTNTAWQQPNYVKLINLSTQATDGYALTNPADISACTTAVNTVQATAYINTQVASASAALTGGTVTQANLTAVLAGLIAQSLAGGKTPTQAGTAAVTNLSTELGGTSWLAYFGNNGATAATAGGTQLATWQASFAPGGSSFTFAIGLLPSGLGASTGTSTATTPIAAGERVQVTNGGGVGATLTTPAALASTGKNYTKGVGYGDLATIDIAAYNVPIGSTGCAAATAGSACSGVTVGPTAATRAWSDPNNVLGPASGGLYTPEAYTQLGAVVMGGSNTQASPLIIRAWVLTPSVLAPIVTWNGVADSVLQNGGNALAAQLGANGATGLAMSNTTGYPSNEKATVVTIGGTAFPNTGATAGPLTQSNCGTVVTPAPGSKPVNPQTGAVYASGDFTTHDPVSSPAAYLGDILAGKTPASVQSVLTTAATMYMMTSLTSVTEPGHNGPIPFVIPVNLCAADLGAAATGPNGLSLTDSFASATNSFSWGTEPIYTTPLTQTGATAGGKVYTCSGSAPNITCSATTTGLSVNGLSFTFPYTSALPLNVTGTSITVGMPSTYSAAGCTADASAAGNLTDSGYFQDAATTTCTKGTGTAASNWTIADTASHNYSAGSFLQAPSVSFSGVKASSATAAAGCIKLVKTTASITLGTFSATIAFAPLGSANAAACIGNINN